MQKPDRFDEILDAIGTFAASVDARFEQMDARFDKMDARFDKMDARFEQADARFYARSEQVDSRFDRLERMVWNNHEKLEKLQDLPERVSSLEAGQERILDILDANARQSERFEAEFAANRQAHERFDRCLAALK